MTHEISTWDINPLDSGLNGMQETPDGLYVRRADHDDVVGQLTNEKCRWFLRAGEYLKRSQDAEAEIARLRAEADALRSALDKIASIRLNDHPSINAAYGHAISTATEALFDHDDAAMGADA